MFLPNVVTFNEMNLIIRLGVFICDAPARGFLKQAVGHTAKHACDIVGEYVAHRVVFNPKRPHPLKFDESVI